MLMEGLEGEWSGCIDRGVESMCDDDGDENRGAGWVWSFIGKLGVDRHLRYDKRPIAAIK